MFQKVSRLLEFMPSQLVNMTLLWGSDQTWWKESPSTLIEPKFWLIDWVETQHHVAQIYQYECAFSPSVKSKRLMNMSKHCFNF
jgi:hypothetical protein